MKRIIIAIALSIAAGCVNAVPANPGVVKVKTADGSIVCARIVGDEYWHCVADLSGNILAENGDGLYEAGSTNLRDIDVKAKMMEGRRSSPQARKPMDASAFTRGIVILAGFSDKPFRKTNAAFDELLNDDEGNCNTENGSAKQYFKNSSFGKFVPQFDVYGPYTLPNTCAYYGKNYGGSGSDQNATQMIVDAVAAYIAERGEDALRQYDCDGDGYVDNIFVFYAGHGENAGGGANCIWPHRSFVYSSWVDGRTTYGGVTLGDYACSCELQGPSGSTMSGIGPFCHEFSHVLGLPDLYDTYYSGHRTCSDWDVMDAGNYLNNEHTPPSYSSYERFYMGWLTPELLSVPDNVTLEGLNSSNTAKIITSTESHNMNGEYPDPEEFFMLEVRDGKGWDKYLPGHGMLITKVNYDYEKWVYNTVNNYANDLGVDIIEAGGVKGYNATSSDVFPGTDDVTQYTPYSGQAITEIGYNRDFVCFKYKGGRNVFKVEFDGMGYGTPSVVETAETAEDGGVELTAVGDVRNGYVFVGWSESSSAEEADAGVAGERYYPERDIRLFAVYSNNGVIVPTERDCETESFDNCTGQYRIDERMDRYTDMAGWYGEAVKCNNGSVKMGSNDERGVLVSPRLHLSGDMTLEVTCKALMNTTLIVTAENGKADSAAIGMDFETVTLTLDAVPIDSRLRFISDANIFFVDNVEFCGAKKSPVGEVEDEQYILVREKDGIMVGGLKGGEAVTVFDMLGRMVGEGTAEGGKMTFKVGKGLFIVRIIDRGKTTVIK
ncbi:MAG: M6 family metalloprotease domain-containing protein [Paludibacteraceae bacterium]|nr:M6 family metalloprotease domain-containing protein [Paludibacteraceae bacterium]